MALRRPGSREDLASSTFPTLTQSQTSSDPLCQLICVGLGSGNHPWTPSPICALDLLCDLRASPCPLWASHLEGDQAPSSLITHNSFEKGCQKQCLLPPAPSQRFNLHLTRDFNRQHFSREFIKTCKHGWGYKILSGKAVKHASVCCVNWIFMSWLFKLQFTTVAGPDE